MARYTDSVCRQCRREGEKLFLKGERCYSAKCAVVKRHTIPGQHGQGRQRKQSEYGIQLREKQKLRRAYGVLESQFRKYYEMAANMRGATGENMLSLLERRLDNVVYRLGLAESRPMARQMVNHGHILVNGKRCDIPSAHVKVGSVITLKEASRANEMYKKSFQELKTFDVPYIEKNFDGFEGTLTRMPERSEIPVEINETLIVELYSK